MPKLRVTIIDEVRNRRLKVDLPDDAAMEKLLPALAKKLGLPVTDSGGQPIAYQLTHETTGRVLGGDQTLASFGVGEGDALRLAAAREEVPVVPWPAEEEAVPIWQKVPVWGWVGTVVLLLLAVAVIALLAGREAKPTPTVIAEVATPTATSAAMPQPTATSVAPTPTPLPPTPTSVPPTPTPPPTPTEEVSRSYEEYISDEMGFSLTYPEGWDIQEGDTPDEGVYLGPPDKLSVFLWIGLGGGVGQEAIEVQKDFNEEQGYENLIYGDVSKERWFGLSVLHLGYEYDNQEGEHIVGAIYAWTTDAGDTYAAVMEFPASDEVAYEEINLAWKSIELTTPTAALPVPTPVPTALPPTDTPTAEPVILFRDDFEGVLAAGWGWVREDSTHWSLADVPGSVRITLQPGGLSSANNLLLREAPAGNFEITTLVRFTPTSNFQYAGLLIYQDDSNAIQFGRAFCDVPEPPELCVGNGIYFDNFQHGEFSGPNYATATANPSQAYLRLRREGATYTSYYSEDGANWIVIGQHTRNITSLRVGLIAAQAEAETAADFDYFTIEALPKVPDARFGVE